MVSPYLNRLPLGVRCIDGRLWKHVPQSDDPYLEQDIGACEGCAGCNPAVDEDESVPIRCRRCGEDLETLESAEGCEDPQCWAQMPGAAS